MEGTEFILAYFGGKSDLCTTFTKIQANVAVVGKKLMKNRLHSQQRPLSPPPCLKMGTIMFSTSVFTLKQAFSTDKYNVLICMIKDLMVRFRSAKISGGKSFHQQPGGGSID